MGKTNTRTAEDKLLDEFCGPVTSLPNYVHEFGRIPYAPITKGEEELKISDASVSSAKIKKYELVRC